MFGLLWHCPPPGQPPADSFVREQEERAWRQQFGTSMRYLQAPEKDREDNG